MTQVMERRVRFGRPIRRSASRPARRRPPE